MPSLLLSAAAAGRESPVPCEVPEMLAAAAAAAAAAVLLLLTLAWRWSLNHLRIVIWHDVVPTRARLPDIHVLLFAAELSGFLAWHTCMSA